MMKAKFPLLVLSLTALILLSVPVNAQDWVHAGTNLGNARIRLAAADCKPVSADPQTPALKATFDATLYSDLQNAGIFDMISKSMAPPGTPGSPQEINLGSWSAAPANAGRREREGYNRDFYEGSWWEYSNDVPHDIPGLVEKMGGREAYLHRLVHAFRKGYIDFGNEPNFMTP